MFIDTPPSCTIFLAPSFLTQHFLALSPTILSFQLISLTHYALSPPSTFQHECGFRGWADYIINVKAGADSGLVIVMLWINIMLIYFIILYFCMLLMKKNIFSEGQGQTWRPFQRVVWCGVGSSSDIDESLVLPKISSWFFLGAFPPYFPPIWLKVS